MTLTGVSDATGRITLKRRRGRRRRLILIGVAVTVLALLGGLAWLLLGSDALGVRAVEVSGNRLVATADVQRIAEIPEGTPLARADLDGAATRISGLPPVAKVSVARQWPNTIRIEITERTPAFAIETPGGYWIADSAGVIFNSAAQAPRATMTARVPSGDPRIIRDLATVVAALPPALKNDVRLITAETPDSITLELGGGVRVIWGSAEQSELKAQILTRLMAGDHRVYDVSAPSTPTVR